MDPSATSISIDLTVTSFSPRINLNNFGGTIITIIGNALPHATSEGNTYSVTFSDGSTCDVVSLSSTMIRCITGKFDVTSNTNPTMIVNVNGVINNVNTVTVESLPT